MVAQEKQLSVHVVEGEKVKRVQVDPPPSRGRDQRPGRCHIERGTDARLPLGKC